MALGSTKCGYVGESLGSTPDGATVSNHYSGHSTSGGLSQDLRVGSLQKTMFEPGRVTTQSIILLLPSLINNIYLVICIGLIPSYLRLISHSVSIDTSGWHLTLSAHRRTTGIFKHALYV